MRRSRPPRLTALALLLAAACGGGGGNSAPAATPTTPTPVIPPAPTVAAVKLGLAPADDVVVVGGSASLSAQPVTASGDAVSGQTIAWSSSDPLTLDVTPASGGASATLAPKKGGIVTLTASTAGISSSVRLAVHEPIAVPAAGAASSQLSLMGGAVAITVPSAAASASTQLHVGPSLKVSPTPSAVVGSVYEFSPDALRLDKPLTVTLQHPATSVPAGSILLLSSRGATSWTALAGGTWDATARTVTASVAQLGAFAAVVQPQIATAITATPASASVSVGGSTQLSVTARDQIGGAMTPAVTWSSAATSVATVSSSGLVQGVSAGTTTITASAGAGITSTVAITVTAPVGVTSVSVSPSSATVQIGDTRQLSATVVASAGIATTVTWSSSDNSKVTVSAAGLATAVAASGAQVCATSTADASKQACAAITVPAPAAPIAVSISPSSASLTVGQALQFSATVTGGPAGTATSVTWVAADATKVSITTSGLATAVAAPGAQICAKSTADVTKQACATVTVAAASFPLGANVETSGDSFSPASVDIAVGGSVGFTFNGLHNVSFSPQSGAPSDIQNTGSGTVSRTFNSVGTFSYQCTLHSGMTGNVIVH
ncbi:MAG: Ig-like domain-containing protein [Gemmatimonadetes bacterium]|nr:Ig-like domain-containing protein [Gemmatimonadota bacterium]